MDDESIWGVTETDWRWMVGLSAEEDAWGIGWMIEDREEDNSEETFVDKPMDTWSA